MERKELKWNPCGRLHVKENYKIIFPSFGTLSTGGGGSYISADFECFSRVSKFSLADFTAISLVQYKVDFKIREIHSKSAKM